MGARFGIVPKLKMTLILRIGRSFSNRTQVYGSRLWHLFLLMGKKVGNYVLGLTDLERGTIPISCVTSQSMQGGVETVSKFQIPPNISK